MARTLVARLGVYSTGFRTLGIVRVCLYTTRESGGSVCVHFVSQDRPGQALLDSKKRP